MSTLSDGLAARDKATRKPWCVYQVKVGKRLFLQIDIGKTPCGHNPCIVHDAGFDSCDLPKVKRLANAKVIAAAPDALDWIAKVLPWIKEARDEIQGVIDSYVPEIMSNKSLEAFREDAAQLTALIAEAEGTEKEGEDG